MLMIATLTLLLSGNPPTLVPKARAWSIESSAVQGAAVLKAGDHVDVLAVLPDPDSKQLTSVMLLQNVIILANKPAVTGGPAFISLLLLPEETELVALARATGTLTFIARAPSDIEVLEERKPVTLKTLLGH